MRVELQRSGGFAGRTLTWSLDLDALDPPARAELEGLLGEAPGWAGAPGPGPDGFTYRLRSEPEPGPGPVAVVTGPPDGVDRARPAGLDVRFGEPLPTQARRLIDVVRAAQP